MTDAVNPLRTYRKSRKIRIDAMAERLGLSSASLSRIERGEQWPGTHEFFEKLAEVTEGQVTADDLVKFRSSHVDAAA